MKKVITVLMTTVVAAGCMLGCSKQSPPPSNSEIEAFNLPHYNGVSDDGTIDSSVFYRNDFSLRGGDAGVIYVDKDQSEEYGGYYYMYDSECDGVGKTVYGGDDPHTAVISCLRSKDLSDWTVCGAVDNGYCVRVETGDWCVQAFWAPEVIYNPYDKTYYMYVSACDDPALSGIDLYDRYYIAVFASETPVGPFKLCTSANYYDDIEAPNKNGKVVTAQDPTIDVKNDNKLDYTFSAIDCHPWYDDVDSDGDGQNDLYLYFVHHVSNDHDSNDIWGMRMKDMISPDYSSARMLATPNYRTVEYKGGNGAGENFVLENYDRIDKFVDADLYASYTDEQKRNCVSKDDYGEEEYINEGPQMWKDGGRYYLTYSPGGVGLPTYQARQSLGTSPLGMFDKPTVDPAMFTASNETNQTILGTGHHMLIDGGHGDLYCVSWPNCTPMADPTHFTGRCLSVDRVHFTEDATYGRIMAGGPTDSLQYKPYNYTGLVNLAPKAKVSATNAASGTEKYLNDEIVTFRDYYKDMEFAANGSTTITLTFDTPVSVSAILVYNSMDYYTAFGEVERILFGLTEKPSWYKSDKYVSTGAIFNLPFDESYIDKSLRRVSQGAAAVASFKEIKVNKIEITVSKKISTVENNIIKISDIVVLGKEG